MGNGSFVGIDVDRMTTEAVRIFPKLSSTCSSTRKCYHIVACQLLIGIEPSLEGKVNLSELRKRERQKVENLQVEKFPEK